MAVMVFGNFFAAKLFLQALASTLYVQRVDPEEDEEKEGGVGED